MSGGAVRRGRWTAGAVWSISGGVVAAVAGVGVVSVGTGAMGLETHTFTRIECHSVRLEKGGTAWHCFGESPAQVRANEEAARRISRDALRAHRDGVGSFASRRQRTRLAFVDHDGQRDPERVTASRLPGGDRWIAHSGNVVGAGVLLILFGTGALVWGGHRVWWPDGF